MAPHLHQHFISAQYCENESLEFNQILHVLWHWQDLRHTNIGQFITELWPFFYIKILFLLKYNFCQAEFTSIPFTLITFRNMNLIHITCTGYYWDYAPYAEGYVSFVACQANLCLRAFRHDKF